MQVALLWTINDFPTYGMLSGWSTSGRLACPYCIKQTKSFQLQNGSKQSWFDYHRHFLPLDHFYRGDIKSFMKDKGRETSQSILGPQEMRYGTKYAIFQSHITDTSTKLGKDDGRGVYHNWPKRSILWDLLYW
jgi:hypothetical protein